ncbi:MAG: ABC-type transport auxiliary lipoprotein family protein, partial [Thermodesulfobacteriota bacterium]
VISELKWKPVPRRCGAALLILCLGFVMGGCSILPQKEPVEVFVLRSETNPLDLAPTSAVLDIRRPGGSGMLRSANILVMPRSHQISVYQGARWNASVPQMLQEYLIRNFSTSSAFAAVVDSGAGVKEDYRLLTDIRAFQSSYADVNPDAQNPMIEVEVDAQLIDPHKRAIVAQRRFTLTEPSSAPEIKAVVEAFNRAAARLSNAMLEWSAQSIPQQEQ